MSSKSKIKNKKLKKKIFIHLGLHKTGSTSIQNFLKKNEKLFLNSGIYIPNSGRINDKNIINHANLAWELTDDKRYDDKIDSIQELIQEIKNKNENILISSEDFENLILFPKKIIYFEKILGDIGFEIKYISFKRDEISHLLSLHNTLNHLNDKISIIKLSYIIFTKGFYHNKNKNWIFYFNFLNFEKKWSEHSITNIKLISFSKCKKNLINSFLKEIDLKLIHCNWDKSNINLNVNHKKEFKLFKKFLASIIFLKYKFLKS